MTKSEKMKIFLKLPILLIVIFIGFLEYSKSNAQIIELPVRGYDPRDFISGHYIRYEIDWNNVDVSKLKGIKKSNFCINSCRFYIPEKEADKLDYLFRNRNRLNLNFTIKYKLIYFNKAIANDILINGLSWSDYLKLDKNSN